MFNVGSGEMILLFVVALMIFGPNRLPEIGRSVGEAMHSFRKAMQSLSEPIMAEVQAQSRQIREAAQPVAATAAALPAPQPPLEAATTSSSSEADTTEPPAAETGSVTVSQVESPAPESEPATEDEPVPMPASAPETPA